jgi:hypothetical protein
MPTTFDLLMSTIKAKGEALPAPTPRVSVADLMRPDATATNKPYRALEKTGRRVNGENKDHGKVVHAVPPGAWNALCGTSPHGRGDWSAWESPAVTCEKCLRKIAALSL